jgi:purine-binding chemotaxis protein CheW
VTTQEAQWVAFHLGAEEYAVPITEVQEIIRVPTIARVPAAPPFVAGVINLRGRIVPVVDLALRLGLASGEAGRARRVVVTHVGSITVGLLVDGVTEVLALSQQHIEAAPTFLEAVPHAACFQGVAKWAGRLLMLLELGRVLTPVEGQALASLPAEA